MKSFFSIVLSNSRMVIIIFLITVPVCALLSTTVPVNYNMVDYLPDNAESTTAIAVMSGEFKPDVPNCRVMLKDTGIPEALSMKAKLLLIEGVEAVNWLDNAVNIFVPLEMADRTVVESWYKDRNALFAITVSDGSYVKTVNSIHELIGDRGIMDGQAVNTSAAMQASTREATRIFLIAIPVIMLILALTTSSWAEPLLFIITIGTAIVINLGTNVVFGQISFVTQAAGSLLQLAVSIDYSIFLLHRFSEFRAEGMEVREAMLNALVKSFSSIIASGLTTVIGFASLILMRFKIGPDMGWVMAKGVLLSLICVMTLLPVLGVTFHKLIDKTRHKQLMPKLKNFKRFILKARVPVFVIFIIIIIPAYLAQTNNDFLYGSSRLFKENDPVVLEQEEIEACFARSNQLVLLMEKGDTAVELSLSNELRTISEVKSVISYVDSVGALIPEGFVPPDILSRLVSDDFTRMLITLDMEAESERTFNVVNKIRQIASKYGTYHLAGESVSTLDMRDVVTQDSFRVNLIAIIAVAIILFFTFRSLSLPILLLIVIETSIWLNLSVPYFSGYGLFYIGYLIISAIQLGATIDYAILYTNRYLENRKLMEVNEAVAQTTSDTTVSILTSASMLIICSALLGYMSSNGITSQLGILVARGGLFSALLVIFVLPVLLSIFDKLIVKTTFNFKAFEVKKPEE